MNAKISDYGISRFSTPDGLMAQEGTPAYRAPEVIRGETYSFKVYLPNHCNYEKTIYRPDELWAFRNKCHYLDVTTSFILVDRLTSFLLVSHCMPWLLAAATPLMIMTLKVKWIES